MPRRALRRLFDRAITIGSDALLDRKKSRFMAPNSKYAYVSMQRAIEDSGGQLNQKKSAVWLIVGAARVREGGAYTDAEMELGGRLKQVREGAPMRGVVAFGQEAPHVTARGVTDQCARERAEAARGYLRAIVKLLGAE